MMVRGQGTTTRTHQRRSEAEKGRGAEFCSARNDPKGQGTILATALCDRGAPCDQHVMQHQVKEVAVTQRNKSMATLVNKKNGFRSPKPTFTETTAKDRRAGQNRLLQVLLLLTQHFLVPAAEKFGGAAVFPKPAIHFRLSWMKRTRPDIVGGNNQYGGTKCAPAVNATETDLEEMRQQRAKTAASAVPD